MQGALAPGPGTGRSRSSLAALLALVAAALTVVILGVDFDEDGLLVRPAVRIGPTRGAQAEEPSRGPASTWAATPEGIDDALASVGDDLARCHPAGSVAGVNAGPSVAAMRIARGPGGAGHVVDVSIEGQPEPSLATECLHAALRGLAFTDVPPSDLVVRFAVQARP